MPFNTKLHKNQEHTLVMGWGKCVPEGPNKQPPTGSIEKEEDVKQKGGGTSQPKGNPEGSGLSKTA
jgi:hypothetical protein